ncbi:major facilitator superfamily protein [Naematelia encephala]|uniref:Major facilitator superfamily protein n=1 Tax=Naematelia encephala TaxID=71784 RepID=A0A1Y2BC92_9TREE|nr:major facilitator superfamily protein [Naematelia encephala]
MHEQLGVEHIYPDAEIAAELEKQGDNDTVFGDKSPGVRRIEAISSCFSSWHRWVLFTSIFLVAFRYTFQNYATADFGNAAQISTIAVVRSIVAAAGQPVFAKISDYFGRISILVIAVVFYVIGTIVSAASKNLGAFSGGAVLYQFGYTGVQLLVEVVIADTTPLRSRLFYSYIPAMPFIINAWVSGNIADAVIEHSTWQWGIGMWAIIFPFCAIPVFYSLFHAEWRAGKQGLLDEIPSPLRSLRKREVWVDLFWQMDVVGLILLAGTFIMILLPFTLAGGVGATWRTAKSIAPLVIGFVIVLPMFIVWELKFARHPVVPFRILKDRQILAGLGIALMLNTTWYTQGDYLYTTLIVSFDLDIIKATRTSYIYSFVSVIIGCIVGLIVHKVRYLKWFVVAGACTFVLAFGLLIRYRGGGTADYAGIVAAETVLGIGGGLLPYSTQALVQSAVQHERTAVITSLFLATYSVGSAIGNTIAAAIWTNTMPNRLVEDLTKAGISNATALATEAYANPFVFIVDYPMGTPTRTAVNSAYREVQRYLCIAGICLATVLVALSLCLKNPRLGDTQSLEDAEGFKTTAAGEHDGDGGKDLKAVRI